jgi:hypothetical protein
MTTRHPKPGRCCRPMAFQFQQSLFQAPHCDAKRLPSELFLRSFLAGRAKSKIGKELCFMAAARDSVEN